MAFFTGRGVFVTVKAVPWGLGPQALAVHRRRSVLQCRGASLFLLAVVLVTIAGCTGPIEQRPGSVHWVELHNDAQDGVITVRSGDTVITTQDAPLGVSSVDVVLGCPDLDAHLDFVLDEVFHARLGGELCQAGELLRIAFGSDGNGTAFVGQAP